MKLPTIKRKLPEVFTDENNYFGKNQSWIDTWHSCNTCVLYCVILAIPAIYLQWWWIVPILAFIGLDGEQYRRRDRGKSGYRIPVSGAHRCHRPAIRRFFLLHFLRVSLLGIVLHADRRVGRDFYRPGLK